MGVGALSAAAVFLDRDGTLNEAMIRDGRPHPPQSVGELVLVPHAAESMSRLRDAGFVLIVVTNQPDVARGTQTRTAVEAINRDMSRLLGITEIRTCWHDDADNCGCRKPQPGLIIDAARENDIDLGRSFMVGDRWRDIQAGKGAGCSTVLIERGYAEPCPQEPDARVGSLREAVDWILGVIGMTTLVSDLKVKVFADGADLKSMTALYANPHIKGFTTNPTLMRKAGIRDYRSFAREVLAAIPDRPISFEVFSDDFPTMERHARGIATWGPNVYVKIPVTNTKREPAYDLIRALSHDGVKLNVTAIMTPEQIEAVTTALAGGAPSCVSVFAGRIADTGRDPLPLMADAVRTLQRAPDAELIWASPRELLNIMQADAIGCHIITVTPDLLGKLPLVGKDLADFSLETVKMFFEDAKQAGFTL